jgi:UDP-N-acetylglucosamine 2-epimerase (non-hydrolysing)
MAAQMGSHVCFVVGARPNFMKAAPVLRALRNLDPDTATLLVHTGQHYDDEMSEVFIRELGLPEPDLFLGVGSGEHGEQTARALAGVAGVLEEHRPELVVVSGDVNSTLAAALAAVKLHIPVAHIESGLRSFDPRMPEEHNRKLTDHMSSILLAHSRSAVDNLAREGIDAGLVHLVGNTMIDSLLELLPRAEAAAPWKEHSLEPGGYGLVTLHRPALVDDSDLLGETVRALVRLSEHLPLVFPVHPRTLDRVEAQGLDRIVEGSRLTLTRPIGYIEFIGLESRAAFVLTDSGGVQEETSALGVPCFTLRDSTERPVTIEHGTNTLLGLDPERIAEIPERLGRQAQPGAIPLWDGHAGERAAAVLAAFLETAPSAAGAVS